MSCEHRDDAGAWVLRALPEDESERFAAHRAGCDECRREVAELQMVADTLSTNDGAELHVERANDLMREALIQEGELNA